MREQFWLVFADPVPEKRQTREAYYGFFERVFDSRSSAVNFGPSSEKHTSEESARAEAERKARQEPGRKFHVFRLSDSVVVPPLPAVWGDSEVATPLSQ